VNRPEEAVQRAIVEWLEWNEKRVAERFQWFAVPNQRGTRKRFEAAILRALGVRPGASDLVLVATGGRAIYVEVKAPGRRGSLSPAQKEWRAAAERLGTPYHVVASVDEFIDVLAEHGIRP
jgi:hypothetical protein